VPAVIGDSLTIIHTGDMHDCLGSAEANCISSLRKDIPDCLLLDSGDAIKAGNLGFRPSGEPVLTLMSELGYHAMALGNREAHLWQAVLERKIGLARFPVLSANLKTPKPGVVKPCITGEMNGIKVGVVGLTVPMITQAMWTRKLCDLLFEDPVATARELVPVLQKDVDLLLLLSHLGERRDREIAETGLFHIILGGHSHTVMEIPERIGQTWLCHTGSHARYAGVWHLTMTKIGWNATGRLRPLRESA
jgi:5'-nucleotidase/2',3'-cyclic-nucleotide 2'-phosphodiesterase/3'-nucleotidase